MNFGSPVPLNTTLRDAVVRTVLPPSLRTGLAHEQAAPLYRRSVFLAAESQAETLQRVNDAIVDVVRGEQTGANAQSLLKRLPEILGHAELSKDYRMKLILDTNIDMARGFGGWLQTQDADILEEYPAWEFYRAEFRKEPRDWPERWAEAGGRFFPGESDYPAGRMIALKNDPIWEEISRFGLPYAPFDFNSGMDLRDIDREEAEDLGLIEPAGKVAPGRLHFNEGVEAEPSVVGSLLMALGGFLVAQRVGHLEGDTVKLDDQPDQ